MHTQSQNFLVRVYNWLNDSLKHLFKPFPVILAIIVSLIEIMDYFTPDPIERITNQIEEYQRNINQLEMVSIPDTLINDEIENIRIIQQKLIAYAKIVNSYTPIIANDTVSIGLQLKKIITVSNASKEIGNLFLLNLHKLTNSNPAIVNVMIMFAPELSNFTKNAQDNFNSKLKKTSYEIERARSKKEKLELIVQFLSSKTMQDWIKANNDFINKAFEFLNVVQLSIAYDIKLDSINAVN